MDVVNKEDMNDDASDSISIGSISEDSMCSSSSSELAEDASSHSNGPLFELSELMNQLPIKRGLSMFYQGKTQSFGSLASVDSIEDLPKKERKKMKSCKSFAGFTPKATISKKGSRATTFVSVLTKRWEPKILSHGNRPVFHYY